MPEKLLILDDELLILKSIESLFEDDYQVFMTTDAETALSLAREHEIAVILSDERMPKVAGHEFFRRVREVSNATRLMLSGYADLTALTEAVNSGQIFAYVSKPWDPLKLKAQVAAAAVHFKLVQEVQEGRGLLGALMENSPDLIYFKDRESRFTRVNQAHAKHLGAKSPAECIGKNKADYCGSEDADRWRRNDEELVRSGQPQIDRIELVNNLRGDRGWWSTTQVPMFDRHGQVSGIAGISRNVTALKNSEEMLREQAEHNRMIIETAYDAFLEMDPDGVIKAWNPQATQIFGWTAAEVLGQRMCDVVIAPAYREAHARGMEHFLEASNGARANRVIELVALHRDGHEFPVEATVWPVRARGILRFNAFVRDIGERRRAEEARKKESTLVQLLQSMTVAANRSSSIEHTAQVCLDKICSYTGWPVGHVYLQSKNPEEGLNSVGYCHVDEDGRYATFREASVSRGYAQGVGLPGAVLKSGRPQWIVNLADEDPLSGRTRAAVEAGLRSGFGFPMVVEDQVIGVLEFFSPQTVQPDEEFLTIMGHIGSQLGQVIRRQRAEEDLRRAKASAESANRAKSEFLTTMSHEMRTPMNAILGMADLLAETSLGEDQRSYVSVFQKAGASLLSLINDLLDLSKVEAGRLDLEVIGFNLGDVLDKLISMMMLRANERGLKLSLEIHPSVPVGLVGDPDRLLQILVNLVGNAVKFTEHGSVLLRVEPDPDGAAGWLRFNVVDTGIGIATDKTQVIFDRFTQADSSTTRKYGGTGLGLAISRGLAELMHGRIGCTSELSKGSIFYLSVPFDVIHESGVPRSVQTLAQALPAGTPAHSPGHRILVAEDSEYNLVLVKAYLKDCGFILDFAENGRIAVDKVVTGRSDLVFMDLQMPVMDGLEATRAIREWEARTKQRPIPILALTAHAVGDGIKLSMEAGCNEHLTKPVKRATLLDAIDRYLGEKVRIVPPEGVVELIPNYLANVRNDMSKILAGVDSKDCGVAQQIGHQFKGSGAGYGFPEITRAGAAVELAAIAADENEIRNQILTLAAYLDQVEVVHRTNLENS